EEQETYLLRVQQGATVIREVALGAPVWIYSAAAQAEDALTGAYQIAVAQVSGRYGPGPFSQIALEA
ncbi:MAG: hypothetical protein OQK05_12845, partial [Pseudopelagicola sp.]|nr:hypothetical protein [Pseudopelagicola sp.]